MNTRFQPPAQHVPHSGSRETFAAAALFIVSFCISFGFARVGWNNAVLDTHGFRQTQTAISTYWMARDGLALDYETPVVGAPWPIPYEFPIYQWSVALVSRAWHMALDPAGRGVALAYFYLSLPAIWLLLRRVGVAAAQRWLFLALLVTCPVYQFYSRAFLIESTAFCFSAWFLTFFQLAVTTGRAWPVAVAALLGCIAGLTKVTTYVVVLAPAAWITFTAVRRARPAWRPIMARALSAIIPGAVAAAWWVQHTDAIKRQNLFGALQTSAAIHEWNYGTWSQRFSAPYWSQLWLHLRNAILPTSSLLLLGVLGLLFLRGSWRHWFACLGLAMAGPLIFANLYAVHDYYFYANAVFFLLLIALPLRRMFETTALPLAARLGVVGLVLIAQFSGYCRLYLEPQARASIDPPPLATAIAQVTQPDDILLGLGMNWSPVYPYYSGRRALMVPDAKLNDAAAINASIARLGPARIATVIMTRSVQPSPEAFRPLLNQLKMEETPLFSTGDFFVYVRKDMLAEALKSLRDFQLKDIWLYNGELVRPDAPPRIVLFPEDIKDRTLLTHLHPTPTKITVPFGLSQEPVDGRLVLNAPASTDIEIEAPAGARRIHAQFGINPRAYTQSDGVEFEIVFRQKAAGPVQLYRRLLQPWLVTNDQGIQTIDLEWTGPLEGTVVFRTAPGPGNQPNYDWAYWAEIDIR